MWQDTVTEPEKQYKTLTEQFKREEEALKKEIAPLEKKATAELSEKTKALQQQADAEIADSTMYKTLLATEAVIKAKRPSYKSKNAATGLMIKHKLHSLVKKDVLQQIQKETIKPLMQDVTRISGNKDVQRIRKNQQAVTAALESAAAYSIAQLEQENPLLQKELRKQCIALGWKNNNGNLEYTTPTGSLITMSDVLTLTHNAYVENAIKLDINSGKNNIQGANRIRLLQAVHKTNEATSTTPAQVEKEKPSKPEAVEQKPETTLEEVPPPPEEPPPPETPTVVENEPVPPPPEEPPPPETPEQQRQRAPSMLTQYKVDTQKAQQQEVLAHKTPPTPPSKPPPPKPPGPPKP